MNLSEKSVPRIKAGNPRSLVSVQHRVITDETEYRKECHNRLKGGQTVERVTRDGANMD